MIKLPLPNGNLYCQLITIEDKPFIFLCTLEDIQEGIRQIYPVRYYSIDAAVKHFIELTKTYNTI